MTSIHIDLDLTVDFDKHQLRGSATYTISNPTKLVRIDYATSTNVRSTTLNWLEPLATDGDVAPFFYTFSEPDRARNWIPLQDTPTVRVTYDATVHVPRGLLAVMSCDDNPTKTSADGTDSFAMKEPIPSYLIALAVGRMEFHAFSDRNGFTFCRCCLPRPCYNPQRLFR